MIKKEIKMKVCLTTELINDIVNYLSNRPFKEVNSLISRIMIEVKKNEEVSQTELNLR
tara:strand:+ start:152 stop:325 length:174 start_codon:yes stop_codon:yes gene_type:complete